MSALKYFWTHQKPVVFLFIAALIGLSAFALRAIDDTRYFNDPDRMEQPIEPWMTPKYVGRSFDLSREEFADILDLEERDGKPPKMGEIAADKGMTLAQIETIIRDAVAKREAAQDADDWWRDDDDNDGDRDSDQ